MSSYFCNLTFIFFVCNKHDNLHTTMERCYVCTRKYVFEERTYMYSIIHLYVIPCVQCMRRVPTIYVKPGARMVVYIQADKTPFL